MVARCLYIEGLESFPINIERFSITSGRNNANMVAIYATDNFRETPQREKNSHNAASVKGNMITLSFSVNIQSVTFVTTRDTVAMSTPKVSPMIRRNATDARNHNVRRTCCRTVRALLRRVGLRSDGSNSRTSLSMLSEENLYLRRTLLSVMSVLSVNSSKLSRSVVSDQVNVGHLCCG
ncbi:hypothetical protein DPMN_101552 [Dreissena polymorpha]|uniref:Uncharacterized protein n=1 Tax=Dreissena polymorpha TaxID=45954 RepID=A0A9D4LHX6_DREPO|nr:hypothetical protein DPMN_101552 [Dreissena polymorpha]